MSVCSDDNRFCVAVFFVVMVFVTSLLIGYAPMQELLDTGHIVTEYNWFLVFLEELLITLTQYAMYCGGLALFWSVIGLPADYEKLFHKVLELYWVQFLAFLFFVVVVFLGRGDLKIYVLAAINVVPLLQAAFLYKSIYSGLLGNKVSIKVFILTTFVLLVLLQQVHVDLYENFVSSYR